MAKKERYRLETLLKMKERQKRTAELALAKAIRVVDEEKEKLKKLEDLKEEVIRKRMAARTQMRERVASGKALVKDSHVHLGYMEKLKCDEEAIGLEIEAQKEELTNAEEKLKRARRDYMDAASELNVMEKHKELWKKKLVKKLTALEDKKMNELANTVFQINKMR